LHTLRWGLVPSWSKTRTGAAKMINARIETLASKPAFRAALRRRRLILPAAGYYEWVPVVNSDGEIAKQPYYLHPADGLLAFAGLYEWWHDDAADSWLLSCTIITTPATGPLGEIHDRTPFCLPRQRIADWLDPALTDTTAIEQLLEPMQLDLDARPVSTLVNKVGNNGALLIAGQDRPSPLVIGSPADSV
jgi:putative SOS response-associated peptidase YedK